MEYINHKTNDFYAGDRAHWRDIPVTSKRPGPDYVPVLEDIAERPYKAHVGWEHQPKPVEPPDSITMRQLIIGLAKDRWIEWPEAEAWADRSTLPAAVNAVIDQMPEEERPAARITAKTMSVAERDNPLLIGAAQAAEPELSQEQLEEMIAETFTRWSEL